MTYQRRRSENSAGEFLTLIRTFLLPLSSSSSSEFENGEMRMQWLSLSKLKLLCEASMASRKKEL